jgi:ApaG protein
MSDEAQVSRSEACTAGVRVAVEASFAPRHSQTAFGQWFFIYRITITNESAHAVQLLTRHWVITDGHGAVREVQGDGVVGETPTLEPGASFQYASGCPLPTPVGTMSGRYGMVVRSGPQVGDHFDAEVATFTLADHRHVN